MLTSTVSKLSNCLRRSQILVLKSAFAVRHSQDLDGSACFTVIQTGDRTDEDQLSLRSATITKQVYPTLERLVLKFLQLLAFNFIRKWIYLQIKDTFWGLSKKSVLGKKHNRMRFRLKFNLCYRPSLN